MEKENSLSYMLDKETSVVTSIKILMTIISVMTRFVVVLEVMNLQPTIPLNATITKSKEFSYLLIQENFTL